MGWYRRWKPLKQFCHELKKQPDVPLVLDPVMVSKSGFHLLRPEAKKALVDHLIPIATMVTPNIPEAEVIAKEIVSDVKTMKRAGEKIHQMGPQFVLMKGGHLKEESVDLLFDGENWTHFPGQRIRTKTPTEQDALYPLPLQQTLERGWM